MRTRLIVLALVAVSAAFAQRGGGSRSRGGSDMDTPVTFGPKSRLEVMSDMLQLSKDQKKSVKSLMDESQKEAAPIKGELSKSRAQIGSAIAAGNQQEIEKAIAATSEIEAKMTAVEMKAFAGIYKLLQPDQRTKTRGLFVMMPGIFRGKNWLDAE